MASTAAGSCHRKTGRPGRRKPIVAPGLRPELDAVLDRRHGDRPVAGRFRVAPIPSDDAVGLCPSLVEIADQPEPQEARQRALEVQGAATDGTVRTQLNPAYGNMMIVTAKDGTETWYCHLSTYRVPSGTTVKAGDPIASSGDSGFTSLASSSSARALACLSTSSMPPASFSSRAVRWPSHLHDPRLERPREATTP